MAVRHREKRAAHALAETPRDGGHRRGLPPRPVRRGGGAARGGSAGAAAPRARAEGTGAGGRVSAHVRQSELPGDRRRAGQNGKLGARDVLPREGTTAKGCGDRCGI